MLFRRQNKQQMKRDVFISHSHQNEKVVLGICKALEKKGVSCFASCRGDMPAGHVITDVIDEAIHQCQVFLVVFSKEAAQSDWVMNRGIPSWVSELKKPVVVFRIDDTAYPDWFEFAYLGYAMFIDASSDYRSKLAELVNTVKGIIHLDKQL